MIIFRRKLYSTPQNITLYHVTKTENVEGIKRLGLKVDKFKERPENEFFGITQKVIYLVKNKNKLVKPIKSPKYSIIELSIPKVVYDRMKKHEGDFMWDILKDMPEKDRAKYVADIFKKVYPEKFGKMTVEEIMKDATPFEYMAPDNTVLILEDIPPKYIISITGFDEFVKNNK